MTFKLTRAFHFAVNSIIWDGEVCKKELFIYSRKHECANWASAPESDTHEHVVRLWTRLHAHLWLNFFFSFSIRAETDPASVRLNKKTLKCTGGRRAKKKKKNKNKMRTKA